MAHDLKSRNCPCGNFTCGQCDWHQGFPRAELYRRGWSSRSTLQFYTRSGPVRPQPNAWVAVIAPPPHPVVTEESEHAGWVQDALAELDREFPAALVSSG